MVLHAKDRQPLVPEAFESLVVEVDVRRLQVSGQRIDRHRESVVLRGDFDLSGDRVQHRLIGPAMPELDLNVFAPRARPSS